MTAIKRLAVSLGVIVSLLSLSVYAQSAGPALNHFASDPISFDYPAEYLVTDESTTDAQQFRLMRPGSSVQLTIVATRGMVLRGDVSAAIENSTEPLIKQIAKALGEGKNPLERTSIKTQVGPKEAEGVRLRSSGRSAKTGDMSLAVRAGEQSRRCDSFSFSASRVMRLVAVTSACTITAPI